MLFWPLFQLHISVVESLAHDPPGGLVGDVGLDDGAEVAGMLVSGPLAEVLEPLEEDDVGRVLERDDGVGV